MVTICFENKDETAEGMNAADAAKTLLDAAADVVGMNCQRPPQHCWDRWSRCARRFQDPSRVSRSHIEPRKINRASRAFHNFLTRSILCNSRARIWPTVLSRLAILESAPLACAAERSPCTFAKWRACSTNYLKTPASRKKAARNRCRVRILRPRQHDGIGLRRNQCGP